MPRYPLLSASLLAFIALFLGLTFAGCSVGSRTAAHSSAEPTAVPTEPSLAPPHTGAYAALGASETYGVGASPHTNGYAWLVARALRARPFVNAGIPGTTLSQGYQTELRNALSIHPSLCTVFFGVNDLRALVPQRAFVSDLYDLSATLRQAGCHVLIIGVPDLSHVPAAARTGIPGLRSISRSWSRAMRRVALETSSQFLDLSSFTAEIIAHPNYISPDGLHPSNMGYQRLAQVVLASVRRHHLWRPR